MLILRIKQAQGAVADGRLDEAYGLLKAEDLRNHRAGQELLVKVAEGLLERGRKHLVAGRAIEAAGDCDRAQKLVGATGDVVALRNEIHAAQQAKANEQRRQAQVVATAQQNIARGQLSVVERVLDEAELPETQAGPILHEVAARRALAENVIHKATAALDRNDWEAAIDAVHVALPQHSSDAQLRQLTQRITQHLLPQIQSALDTGRLDVAHRMLQRLEKIDGRGIETEQLRQTLRQCRQVWDAFNAGGLHEAEEAVRRLATLLPKARWVEPAHKLLRQAIESTEDLRAGPLSLLADAARHAAYVPPAVNPPIARQGAMQPPPLPGDLVPDAFTLRVDGVGSFRVLRQRRIVVGPVSGSRHVDLALMADASLPAVTLERSEEDYFLRSPLPVEINGKPALSKMLRHNDRIGLSARCRMAFVRPTPASNTAVIQLTSARLARADVRAAILMDRELVIGPGGQAHIRVDGMAQSAILFIREGKLLIQSQSPEPLVIDGNTAGPASTIPANAQVTLGGLSFVVTRD